MWLENLTGMSWVNKVGLILNTSVSSTNTSMVAAPIMILVVEPASDAIESHWTSAIFVILVPSSPTIFPFAVIFPVTVKDPKVPTVVIPEPPAIGE